MFDAGAIVGKMILDNNQWNQAVSSITRDEAALRQKIIGIGEVVLKFGQTMVDSGKQIYMVSRQIANLGRNLAFFGTGIIAPMLLAFKSAEKYSTSVRQEMERLNNVTIQMMVSVSEALVPIIHTLSNALADLLQRWNSLSPALRASILQATFMAGTWMLLGGLGLSLVGKIGQIVGRLWQFSGALFLTSLHFMALIPLMQVFTTFRLMGLQTDVAILAMNVGILYPLLLSIGAAFVGWKLGSLIADVTGLSNSSAGLNEVLNYLEWLSLHVASGLTIAAISAVQLGNAIATIANLLLWFDKAYHRTIETVTASLMLALDKINDKIRDLESGKPGVLAGFAEDLKIKIEAIKGLFTGLGKTEFSIPDKIYEASKTFAEGWHDALQQVNHDLHNWGAMATNIVQQTASQMQSLFSSFFQDFLSGQLKTTQEYFAAWGQYILKIISDVIAQIITAKIISSIFGVFSGGTANIAGMGSVLTAPANYFAGHAEGIERVPYTGLYKLHTDETVLRPGETSKNEIPLTIYNLITPEAIAQAMAGKEGKGVIVNVIDANSARGGLVRRMIKRG